MLLLNLVKVLVNRLPSYCVYLLWSYPRPSVWGSQFVFSSCNLSMFICDWTYNRFCRVCQLKVFRTGFPVSIIWLISNPWFVEEMSEIRDCNFVTQHEFGRCSTKEVWNKILEIQRFRRFNQNSFWDKTVVLKSRISRYGKQNAWLRL